MSSSPTDGLVEVTMPQMGVSIAEGTVVEWLKQPGEAIDADEPIVEISTDKAESELPAPAGGRLKEVLVQPGETVAVGTVLATIEPVGAERGEQPAEHAGNGGPPVTPVVQRMAREHQIDVSQIRGSGRGGRVTKKDVLAHLEEPEAAPVLHSESPYREEEDAPAGRELSVMRKRIAEHMLRSVHTAAHCTTIAEADMSRIEAVRARHSYLPFVARAVVEALREHPALNATLEDERLTQHEPVHLGIAVSLGEDGLVVPVIRDAHEFSPEGLAARIDDLAQRARAKRLSPDELHGGTFTITSPGAYGALMATPIINQPQVAILDLEAVIKRPVVVTDPDGRDSIAIRPMTYLCLSWDHRALDGALAAQFLATLRRRVEAG